MTTTPSHTPDDQERLVVEVHGHVQGVGFRYFTRGVARKLNIRGLVRNDPNGIVTVVAEGPSEALNEFLSALHQGPDLAEVDEVDESWEAARGRFDGFSIEYY
ncbi:MAG: acylphosphatase [Bacteroidota bacterium]